MYAVKMPKAVNLNHALVLFNPLMGPLSGAAISGQSVPGSADNT